MNPSVSAWTRLPVIDTTRPSSTFTSRLQRSGQSSGQTESTAGMPRILPRLETQLPEKERPGVRRLLDDLGERLADAVSGLGLDAQEDRLRRGGRLLKARRHLARVHRVDPAVALRRLERSEERRVGKECRS